IVTVDISGRGVNWSLGTGDNVTYTIAAGYGTYVTVFNVSINRTRTPRAVYFDEIYTANVGFDVDYVVVSEAPVYGAYVVVAGNDRPFSNTSHGYVTLYAPYGQIPGPEPLLYEIEVNHSIYASESKPIDITRGGRFVAFGTGIVDDTPPANHIGTVYVVETPAVYTPSPNTWTYDYQDWIQSVRFAGDNRTLIVGTFWNHSFAKFDISNLPNFTPDWKEGNIGDPYYAVAPTFDAENIATGHGWENEILFERGSDGGRDWLSEQNGTQRRIVLDDENEYFVSTQYPCDENESYAFHYFNTTTPFGIYKDPAWTFIPTASPSTPVTVDSSVSNRTRFIIGGTGPRVYRWGNGTDPITWSTPNYTFVANGTVNEVAMSHDGEYSVAGDSEGYLYVFVKDEALPIANWRT
ncbi:MAG: hypothetical protein KAW09_11640, partial [Thermoplasmata archaeon]|nr:hypothetical protein [Thermoplasmata archaeon]